MMHTTSDIPTARLRTWLTPRSLWRRPFVRNAMVVIGGTATAQAITVVFSPVITRLYSPDAFGALGVFTSVISILTPIAALCYPHAIVLPPEDEDGLRLTRLSVLIAVSMTVLMAAIIIPFRSWLASLFGLESVTSYLWLVPIIVLLAAVSQAYDQWLIRKKLFRVSSGIAIAQALAVNGGKIALGLLAPSAAGLIGVSSVGHGMHAALSALGSRATRRKAAATIMGGLADRRTMAVAREYRDFALYRTPQVVLNSISQNLPVVILASLFGPSVAGLYALGYRVLKLPGSIISQAVGKVFLQRIAEAAHRGQDMQRLIIRATLGLAVAGCFPFGLIIVLGPRLFSFVFGAEWTAAGEYSRWMALWLFSSFLNVPSVMAIPLLSLQGNFLFYEVVTVTLRTSAIVIGSLLHSATATVALYSIVGALMNICLVAYIIHQSGRRKRTIARRDNTSAP